MKNVIVTCFACLVLYLFSPGAGAQTAAARPDLVVAYSRKAFPDLDAKDVAAAMQLYMNELGKQAGGSAGGYVYDTMSGLIRDIQAGKVDLIALSSVAYLRIRDSVDVELALGHVKGGKKTVKYLVVVNTRSPLNSVADLKGRRVNVLKGDDIGPMYLNFLLLKHKLPDIKKCFSSVEEKNKPSQLVLPVFFGQADACIITDVALKNMTEMNPQIGKATRVLASSEELAESISVLRRAVKEDVKQKAMDVGTTLNKTPRGRQVLMLFKIEGLSPIKEADLAGIKRLLSEHDRLTGGK